MTPPDGPPWDLALSRAPLAFLDLEMTGTDPKADRICEVAVRRLEGGREVGRVESLVRPGRPVGGSEKVHGLSDAVLAEAPPWADVADEVAQLLEGAVPVGHRLMTDVAFLAAVGPAPSHYLCTATLAKRTYHRGGHALAALAERFELPAPSHRAMSDAVSCAALFGKLVQELQPGTARHLWQAQCLDGEVRMRDDFRERLEAALADGRSVRIRYRVPGKPPFEDDLEVRKMLGPRVVGRLRRRAEERVLRGDRLLAVEASAPPHTEQST